MLNVSESSTAESDEGIGELGEEVRTLLFQMSPSHESTPPILDSERPGVSNETVQRTKFGSIIGHFSHPFRDSDWPLKIANQCLIITISVPPALVAASKRRERLLPQRGSSVHEEGEMPGQGTGREEVAGGNG